MATPHNIELPTEFSGPAQLILYTRYGNPCEPGWENKWIVTWMIKDRFPWFPETEIKIHKHFKPLLEKAFTELALYDLYKEIKTFDGCFKFCTGDENAVMSVHAWGAAIDLNAADNPLSSMGKWSPEFIEVMTKNGVFAGQQWTGRKSPMHFGMVNG